MYTWLAFATCVPIGCGEAEHSFAPPNLWVPSSSCSGPGDLPSAAAAPTAPTTAAAATTAPAGAGGSTVAATGGDSAAATATTASPTVDAVPAASAGSDEMRECLMKLYTQMLLLVDGSGSELIYTQFVYSIEMMVLMLGMSDGGSDLKDFLMTG